VGSNPTVPTDARKGKPTSAMAPASKAGEAPKALEGSTPSPSAVRVRGRVARRISSKDAHAGSTPAGHSRGSANGRPPGSEPGNVRSSRTPRTIRPRGAVRSARHPLTVETAGSNPAEDTATKHALVVKAGHHTTLRRWSSWFNSRLGYSGVSARTYLRGVPEAREPPKLEDQVRFLAEILSSSPLSPRGEGRKEAGEAQQVEQRSRKATGVGSIPTAGS
jgi:hypothetical protein